MRTEISLAEARRVLRDHLNSKILSREDEVAIWGLFYGGEVRRAPYLPGQFVHGAATSPSWGLGLSAVLLVVRPENKWAVVDELNWPELSTVPRYGIRLDQAAELLQAVFPDAEFSVEATAGEVLMDYRATVRVRREHLSVSCTQSEMGTALVGALITALVRSSEPEATHTRIGMVRYHANNPD